MTPRDVKSIATKALRLDKCLIAYHAGGSQNKEVVKKFVAVWGSTLAAHFLSKYDNAESLIWALDSNNLQLFIEKF